MISDEEAKEICQNGGSCIMDHMGKYVCTCPQEYTGSKCQDLRKKITGENKFVLVILLIYLHSFNTKYWREIVSLNILKLVIQWGNANFLATHKRYL